MFTLSLSLWTIAILAATIQTSDSTSQHVVLKRIGKIVTDVHFHHIEIPVNIEQFLQMPTKAIETIKSISSNVDQQSSMNYQMDPRNKNVKAYLGYKAAQLRADSNEFILKRSCSQLTAVKEYLNLKASTWFGRGKRTLFDISNFINPQQESSQLKYDGKSIKNMTHIAEIQENYLSHLDINVTINRYLTLQGSPLQIKAAAQLDPALLFIAAQEIISKTTTISDDLLSAIQQVQMNRLSTNFLQGSTINKIYNHLLKTASSQNMELLISRPSDLFQIDVSYYYKSHSQELNIFLHTPMVKSQNIMKFFKFIPFPLTQFLGKNISLMPKVKQDLIAVGSDLQYKILSESDMNACTRMPITQLGWQSMRSTYICRGLEVLKVDLAATCLGAYYLGNITAIQHYCKFEHVPSKEHVFQLSSHTFLISSPISFSANIKCPTKFIPIRIQTSSIVTIPGDCILNLKSHVIQQDNYLDTDLETIHYQWNWESDKVFSNYNFSGKNETFASLEKSTDLKIYCKDLNSQLLNVLVSNFKSPISHSTTFYYFIISCILISLVWANILKREG